MPKQPRLTEAEKERRKHQRKADRMNAAEAKAHGPLFAHLAPTHTADDAYHGWRLQKARSAEMDFFSRVAWELEWIVVVNLERWVSAHVPEAEAAIAQARRTFSGKPDYIRNAWKEALTGRGSIMLTCAWDAQAKRLSETRWPAAPMQRLTTEEFDRLFPGRLYAPEAEPTPDETRFAELAELLGQKRAS